MIDEAELQSMEKQSYERMDAAYTAHKRELEMIGLMRIAIRHINTRKFPPFNIKLKDTKQ